MHIQEIRSVIAAAAMAALPLAGASPAAADMAGMQGMAGMPGTEITQIAGPYRIVLVVLPAEPFYTQAQVAQTHVKDGMVVVGGAAPVPPDDASHPNHHLVVHLYDRATGKAVRGGHVTMTYAPASADSAATSGASVKVPIVEMQAIGKGPESTHYGNNVTLAPGSYRIAVTANGASTSFTVRVA
jgi:hypothetical protein